MAYGDAGFGFLPKLLVSADRDLIKKTDERTYEATIDLTSVPINLGGCGNALSKGCTYWDLMGGAYSNDVRSSDNGAGRGRVNGARIVIQLHSFPFPETTSLAPLSLTLSVEGQWDISASADRIKQDRHIVKAALGWKFYVGNPKYKPSIALVRVVGSNLLTGQENVAYTQLALRLEI
ncbi:MAG: hypothetical protein M3Y65_23845 [Pseudomonadota bacterium]|nr:hypothetical protein [Pseudomonadota bacterium]